MNYLFSIVLPFFFFISFPLFALVGGRNIYNRPQVVGIHDFQGGVYCSGAVVGVNPLTVLTAAHCVKDREILDIVIEESQPLKVILANDKINGLDLAILIFKSNIKIKGVSEQNIFKLDGQKSLGLQNYRGRIEMCGLGGEINSSLISQRTGNLKCGSGLYLAQKSYSDRVHSLFSKKFMSCADLAKNEDYQGLKISTIFPGDSGGPLFIQNNEEFILVGITKSYFGWERGGFDKNGKHFDCDIEDGAGFQFDWTSVLPSNDLGTLFLKMAKDRHGADIQGL